MSELYQRAAADYALFRPQYPACVLHEILSGLPTPDKQTYLDIGCGPGTLTIPLNAYFKESLGVDISSAMIAAANAQLRQSQSANISFLKLEAEKIAQLPETMLPGPLGLVTIGTAFHWMDQDKVLSALTKVFDRLGRGKLSIVTAFSLQPSSELWKIELKEFFQQTFAIDIFGNRGSNNNDSSIAALSRNNFKHLVTKEFEVRQFYSIDSLIGFLQTTSFGALDKLGPDGAQAYLELKERLIPLSDKFEFSEIIRFSLLSSTES